MAARLMAAVLRMRSRLKPFMVIAFMMRMDETLADIVIEIQASGIPFSFIARLELYFPVNQPCNHAHSHPGTFPSVLDA